MSAADAARPRLSVAIITRDEEHSVRACLESVSWADEIVVLDSGSTDGTADLCRSLGARVEITDWPGFGPQKNRAIERCSGDWILSIDADERVTPLLRTEIVLAIASPGENVAYRLARRSSYCGRPMRHGGWWPDYVVRLVRRGRGRFTDDVVHERLIVDGRIGTLRHALEHDAIASCEEALAKINAYSTLGAERMHRQGRTGSLSKAMAHGLWTFVRTYFVRLALLDGREGFMLAFSNAEGAYYRYLKLMLLGERGAQTREGKARSGRKQGAQ